jgi:hypothetical protein
VRLEVELRDVHEDEPDDRVLERSPVEGPHEPFAVGAALDVPAAGSYVHAHHYGGLVDADPSARRVIVVLAALFGILAAAWPARRAAKLDILNSIQSQ